jgi:hypothetical protein
MTSRAARPRAGDHELVGTPVLTDRKDNAWRVDW